MSVKFEISFAKSARLSGGLAILLKGTDSELPAGAESADPANVFAKAAPVSGFKSKALSSLDIIAPEASPVDRIIVIGAGKAKDLTAHDWLKLGGTAAAKIRNTEKVAIFLDAPSVEVRPKEAADFALGMLLRAYSFDTYKTKKGDEDEKGASRKAVKVTIVTQEAAAAKKLYATSEAVAGGVILARDLVNEPPNVLGPVEFAAKAKELEKLGVEIEILTEREMRRLGMAALLGVAQGSARPPRLVVMQWKGGKAKDKPVAFIGKGVVFDTGGISIKPAAGMEEMKGIWEGLRPLPASCIRLPHAKPRSTPSASSVLWKTCPTAMHSARAISSPPCPARRSRSSTRMPRAGSFSAMHSGTRMTASSRSS